MLNVQRHQEQALKCFFFSSSSLNKTSQIPHFLCLAGPGQQNATAFGKQGSKYLNLKSSACQFKFRVYCRYGEGNIFASFCYICNTLQNNNA